jgi:DNA-binding NarL/FixJ family response regulator
MATSVAPLEILLVEDHPADVQLAVEALRLTNEPNRLHLVKDGEEAIAFIRKDPPFDGTPHPDLVLLDLAIPKRNGREVFEEIRKVDVRPPVIILSSDPGERAGRYLHAGAADFIVKGDFHQLPLAVRAVVSHRAPLRKLSPRQIEVLQFIANGHATRDIALRLNVSGKTVEAHRAELMRRLGIRTVAGLVRYALKACLVELDPD